MSDAVEKPLVLSTPDAHILDQLSPRINQTCQRRSPEQISITYEVDKTVARIREGKWTTVALQFPDDMLSDAPTVFEALSTGLRASYSYSRRGPDTIVENPLANPTERRNVSPELPNVKLYILADTSYGSCCVDEIAAEHINADVVVHYGRACLSPTARLPVIYVFTIQPIAIKSLTCSFQETFPNYNEKIILMADVTYSSHLPRVAESLKFLGYTNLHAAHVVYDPSSLLPNRTVPEGLEADPAGLKQWHLFHISEPPKSLVLILSSRVSEIHIFDSSPVSSNLSSKVHSNLTALALRRRYAILTSVSSASVIGILINTLSVKNYLSVVEHVKRQINAAGKRSYTFVVGKINAAKIANFSEIDGWVVIGCWESSLIDNKDFWKPVLTPFELDLALQKDEDRIWTGKWISDFQSLLDEPESPFLHKKDDDLLQTGLADERSRSDLAEVDSESDSIPPEFDLRLGRYVSGLLPKKPSMKLSKTPRNSANSSKANNNLIKRANGDLATIGGNLSPGAEYLRSKKTWKGLGSDFNISYESEDLVGATIQEGRSGIARGYSVEDGNSRR